MHLVVLQNALFVHLASFVKKVQHHPLSALVENTAKWDKANACYVNKVIGARLDQQHQNRVKVVLTIRFKVQLVALIVLRGATVQNALPRLLFVLLAHSAAATKTCALNAILDSTVN